MENFTLSLRSKNLVCIQEKKVAHLHVVSFRQSVMVFKSLRCRSFDSDLSHSVFLHGNDIADTEK